MPKHYVLWLITLTNKKFKLLLKTKTRSKLMNFNILKMLNLKDKLVLRPTNKMTKKYQIHNSRLIILIKLVMIVIFKIK
jgi:hypothetical protein